MYESHEIYRLSVHVWLRVVLGRSATVHSFLFSTPVLE